MAHNLQEGDLAAVLTQRVLNIVRSEARDLSLRQLAVLLVCTSSQEPQTIRRLAEILGIPKPAVSRAVDRLQIAGLVRRKPDPNDQRWTCDGFVPVF